MIVNHNTLNYVGLVKQANLFTKLFGLGKKVEEPKPLFYYERPSIRFGDYKKPLPEGFKYEADKLPRPTRFFDIDDDPYTPEGKPFRQPRPEDYADVARSDANRNRWDSDFYDEYTQTIHIPQENLRKYPDPGLDMRFGIKTFRSKIFHQLMDKLNIAARARGSNKNAYDDPHLVAKMQRYADTMVRSQGYGKHL